MSEYLKSVNPLNGNLVHQYKVDSADEAGLKIVNARKAFERWRQIDVMKRAEYLLALSDYFLKQKRTLAETITVEMGKPIKQSVSEIEKCATALAYYAKNGARFLEPEIVKTEAQKSFISFRPLGTVLAVMPWNFPFWQVVRAMGPILIAGNSMVLKHASNVTGCALAIGEAVRNAGFPDHLFQNLLLPSSEMENVIAHKDIHALTFTGSTSAGAKVASIAAAHLKKQVLELGGSDPYVILEDADLPTAVAVCVKSRLINTGQSCISAKRFIVDRRVIDDFTAAFVQKMKGSTYGDPMDPSVDLGPLARKDLRDALHSQVVQSIELGAQLECGGFIPEEEGAFYPPTVLTNVKKGMPAYEEELFGPVAAIIRAEDTDDAIKKANDSVFGLGAAVFSSHLKSAERIAEKHLEAGSVFINELVSSDPRLPFGGIKQSGYGRELGYFAIREFTNIKTIFVK